MSDQVVAMTMKDFVKVISSQPRQHESSLNMLTFLYPTNKGTLYQMFKMFVVYIYTVLFPAFSRFFEHSFTHEVQHHPSCGITVVEKENFCITKQILQVLE